MAELRDDNSPIAMERIELVILLIRGEKIMVDEDLARLYGTTGQPHRLRPLDARHNQRTRSRYTDFTLPHDHGSIEDGAITTPPSPIIESQIL